MQHQQRRPFYCTEKAGAFNRAYKNSTVSTENLRRLSQNHERKFRLLAYVESCRRAVVVIALVAIMSNAAGAAAGDRGVAAVAAAAAGATG